MYDESVIGATTTNGSISYDKFDIFAHKRFRSILFLEYIHIYTFCDHTTLMAHLLFCLHNIMTITRRASVHGAYTRIRTAILCRYIRWQLD